MGAQLVSWPGDPAIERIQLIAALAKVELELPAPDADVKTVRLTNGKDVIEGVNAIARYVVTIDPVSRLYPSANYLKSSIDAWVDNLGAVEGPASLWTLPTCHDESFTDEMRERAKGAILTWMGVLEGELKSKTFLVGEKLSLADLSAASALLPLFKGCFGETQRQTFPNATRWFTSVSSLPDFGAICGEAAPCANKDGWVLPAAVAAIGGRKKKGEKKEKKPKEAAAAPAAAPAEPEKELDPEKAAKKAAKQAEKEAKLAKMQAKKAKLEAEAKAKEASGGNSKKEEAKKAAAAKLKAEMDAEAAIVAAALATPKGQKKNVNGEMPKAFNPRAVEAAWYSWWEESGFFKPDLESDKPPFTIVIPPPNVTGSLHLGHALTVAIEDTIVRWRRMSGYNVCWVPGTDHAGIATQTVVEKKLMKERKITRHDLGREKFLQEVWGWKEQYGSRINNQIRRTGASVDWSRESFTMDPKLNVAVKEAFVTMFDDGLIYRSNRLVNWCCRLKTAISEIEVDHVDLPKRTMMMVPGYDKPVEFGVIISFAYPLEDGSDELVVATTRIETMLGDTAVAVHPDDPRYKKFHGKKVRHPFNGRLIPIITDAILVDMAFGTGCVKITPAHDPNDFATGKRHKLEEINIFTDDGLVNEEGGDKFTGMPRFVARVAVIEALKELDLYRGTADNPMRLGLCSRSKDVIEPMMKPQWWVDCKDMAAAGCKAVRDGELEIIPKIFEATWFNWLENIRDWCVSRQLWWGHRIPAFYVRLGGRDEEEARARAQAKFPGQEIILEQDEDVLDTWFSSGLFPFSVYGWPEPTLDLEKFFPTALLETGHDILFFWVARMVMMGMKIMGKVPFKQVYLHAMVRDAHGRKMSKSLGNVIDPMMVIEGITLDGLQQTVTEGNLDPKEVKKAHAGQKQDFPNGIPECGTDAMRFTLLAYTSQARDINLDIQRVVGYRMWCNKLWNAIKFAMMNLGEGFTPSGLGNAAALPMPCRWVLSKLNAAVAGANAGMEAYAFSDATTSVYAFWKYSLCDVFIELVKPVVAGGDEATKKAFREVLYVCLETGLRLLHPIMPFVTEELWQRLPRAADAVSAVPSIMVADYPKEDAALACPAAEEEMELLQSVVKAALSLRADYGLTKQKPKIFCVCKTAEAQGVVSRGALWAATLSTSEGCEAVMEGGAVPAGCAINPATDAVAVHMVLAGILDPEQEIGKLEKKAKEVQVSVENINKKVAAPDYATKVPAKVQEENSKKLAALASELETIEKAINDFKCLL